MARWEPDARQRLEQAATELYQEHGFENVTVAEIAERAGLTERTFFRHFADKREVLFSGAAAFEEHLVQAALSAPETCSPIEAVGMAIGAAADRLQRRRQFALLRQTIISKSPDLLERERIKLAALAVALAKALRQRGTPEPTANLAAEMGVVVFRLSFERWIAKSNKKELPAITREAFAELQTLSRTQTDSVGSS